LTEFSIQVPSDLHQSLPLTPKNGKTNFLLPSNESKNWQHSLTLQVISAGVWTCEWKKATEEDKAQFLNFILFFNWLQLLQELPGQKDQAALPVFLDFCEDTVYFVTKAAVI